MKTTVIGAYPKNSDGRQDLRRALHRADRGELAEAELDRVYEETTAWAIDEMLDAGVDIVGDGQIRWDDLLAPFARAWRNVERGPLERFYDNNTYFRQPVISGPIETDGKTLVRDYVFADRHVRGRAAVKAAIVGPLTFATLTAEDRHYRSLEDRTLAVADALAKELVGLKAAGAKYIDVEEPGLAAHPELVDLAVAAYTRLAKADAPLTLQPYFFPVDRIADALFDWKKFPVAILGLDVRSRETSARIVERLSDYGGTVCLGVIDARNTRVETARETAELVEAALRRLGDERRLYLSTTTGLEYLPHDVAVKKLRALTDAGRAVLGVHA